MHAWPQPPRRLGTHQPKSQSVWLEYALVIFLAALIAILLTLTMGHSIERAFFSLGDPLQAH